MSRIRNVSLAAIGTLLGGEGFTDHCAQMVKRYWLNRHVTRDKLRRVKQVKRAFNEQVGSKLSAADRLILGKFIALISKASFETGLRTGLMTLATEWGDSDFARDELGLHN